MEKAATVVRGGLWGYPYRHWQVSGGHLICRGTGLESPAVESKSLVPETG